MKKPQRVGAYLTRKSYRQATYHFFDKRKNLGYDWRDKLLVKSLSSYLLADPKRFSMIVQLQKMLVNFMDEASRIKKAMNIYTDKNAKYFN